MAKEIKTINIAPTWTFAARVYTEVLQDEKSSSAARIASKHDLLVLSSAAGLDLTNDIASLSDPIAKADVKRYAARRIMEAAVRYDQRSSQ